MYVLGILAQQFDLSLKFWATKDPRSFAHVRMIFPNAMCFLHSQARSPEGA